MTANVTVTRMYYAERWKNQDAIASMKQSIKTRRAEQYEFNARIADELGIPSSDIPSPPKATK